MCCPCLHPLAAAVPPWPGPPARARLPVRPCLLRVPTRCLAPRACPRIAGAWPYACARHRRGMASRARTHACHQRCLASTCAPAAAAVGLHARLPQKRGEK
ncbi:unnamed protein product [Urochloa humidicola]